MNCVNRVNGCFVSVGDPLVGSSKARTDNMSNDSVCPILVIIGDRVGAVSPGLKFLLKGYCRALIGQVSGIKAWGFIVWESNIPHSFL